MDKAWLALAVIVLLSGCSGNIIGQVINDPNLNLSIEKPQDDPLTDQFNKLVMGDIYDEQGNVESAEKPGEKAPEQQAPIEVTVTEPVEIASQQALSQEATVMEPNTIYTKNNIFNPNVLEIEAGTEVTWVNDDTRPHIISMFTKEFRKSPRLTPGENYSYTFEVSGEFLYQDVILLDKMRGTIIVK